MQLKGEHRVVSCGCYQRACMKMHEREDEVEKKMTGGIVVNQATALKKSRQKLIRDKNILLAFYAQNTS